MPAPTTQAALARMLTENAGQARMIVAIAGAPGAGKSNFAEELCAQINAAHTGLSAVLPMDGYHFDDSYLGPRGWQARKGAPHTFDVGGLGAMLARLRANTEANIAVPVFDRTLEIARAGARMIPQRTGIILVEGNYLLLNAPPWCSLRQYFDTTIMLDVPVHTLTARLQHRWATHGYSPKEADKKIAGNDMLNVKEVLENSALADYVVHGATP